MNTDKWRRLEILVLLTNRKSHIDVQHDCKTREVVALTYDIIRLFFLVVRCYFCGHALLRPKAFCLVAGGDTTTLFRGEPRRYACMYQNLLCKVPEGTKRVADNLIFTKLKRDKRENDATKSCVRKCN